MLRPRADEAHLAHEHVPELWQLVELRPREPAAEAREPCVVGGGECRASSAVVHLPKLQHRELGAVEADPPAAEEDGSAAVALDRDGQEREHRSQQRDEEARDHQIDEPLERGAKRRVSRGRWGNAIRDSRPSLLRRRVADLEGLAGDPRITAGDGASIEMVDSGPRTAAVARASCPVSNARLEPPVGDFRNTCAAPSLADRRRVPTLTPVGRDRNSANPVFAHTKRARSRGASVYCKGSTQADSPCASGN